ncbi:MAG: rhomboid family intramembrane serine protease [Ignavibacteriae bacterium]|nr:rhomboid family intramembrane serine protease [Ignavibacteriota bacterium]NOG96335.1 rhomboid family intramembrane serine protease [Ignavibacteriota bacterium]
MGFEDRGYHRPTGFRSFSFFPPVIKYLLIINVAVFFIQFLLSNINFGGIPGWYILNRYFALNPITGVDIVGNPYNFQIWQLITYQFMHSTSSIWHIAMNMFILWMFGMEIENRWGSKKFLLFYLLGGIGAGILQISLSPVFTDGLAVTIGASGAVYAVMVAFAMFFPDRNIYLYFLLPIKAKYFIALWVLIDFFAIGSVSPTAHLAHVGGAITGFLFILLDRRYNFNVEGWFSSIKDYTSDKKDQPKFRQSFRKPTSANDIQEAKFYDLNSSNKKSDEIDQDEIDRILDKISQSGYQNLTAREKKILFEASKKE